MKRLYVTPEDRGLGLGKTLVNAIVDVATAPAYRGIRLDTLPSMWKAGHFMKRQDLWQLSLIMRRLWPGHIFWRSSRSKEVSIEKLYRLILIFISVRCGSFGNRRFRPIFKNLQNSAKFPNIYVVYTSMIPPTDNNVSFLSICQCIVGQAAFRGKN